MTTFVVVGRVSQLVAHNSYFNMGMSSSQTNTVVQDRWSLTAEVVQDRFYCTICFDGVMIP